MAKPGYITMTQRQSNNQWSGGIAAHPTPKNYECKIPLEMFLPQFLGTKTTSSSSIIFQRAKLPTWSITHHCWCKWRTFWRKNAAGSLPSESCSCMTMHRLTGHLQPRRNWSTLGFQCLDHPHHSSNLAPSEYYLFPGLKKTIERSPFFVRRGGHCCRGDLVWQTTFCIFFLSGLWKLEQRAKKYIELRREYVE